MQQEPRNTGWIEVICGPMYSEKSTELIRRLRRAEYAKKSVLAFKHISDQRYDATDLATHSKQTWKGITVRNALEIEAACRSRPAVVGIDEAQFFDEALVEVVESLADNGAVVIVAGLDQDYLGRPFGCMPAIMAKAEYVTKNLAICVICGNPAGRTQRLTLSRKQIEVGSTESYEARCRKCHSLGGA